MTLVLAFVITGASAQILTDYAETNVTDMYQTEGTTFRLYTLPDPIYSPTYVAATNANLGANAQWTFTFGLTATAPVVSGVAVGQNWVEFTNPTVAGSPYTVTVAESNTGVGCGDVTPESQVINVVAVPTATITTADITNYCGNQLAEAININFVENVPDALAAFGFAVSEVVDEIDGGGGLIVNVSTNNIYEDFTLIAKAKHPANLGGATPNFTYGFNSSALVVSNNHRTRYTYTLLEASDAGTGINGIISAISQKSGYIDGLVTYAFTDNSVVFIVNPAPVTGPIYHIANGYAY